MHVAPLFSHQLSTVFLLIVFNHLDNQGTLIGRIEYLGEVSRWLDAVGATQRRIILVQVVLGLVIQITLVLHVGPCYF